MRGDFSRLVLDGNGYSRVLMLQGSALMDSDWNSAVAELLAAQRVFAADVIGPHGGPAENLGFTITTTTTKGKPDLQIEPGVYYVDGIRCAVPDTGSPVLWSAQPYPPFPQVPDAVPDLPPGPYLVYLDVWERLITSLQDGSIREVALGGPDTTVRTQVVWQVKVAEIDPEAALDLKTSCPAFPLQAWRGERDGHAPALRVWVGAPVADDEPCPVGPEPGYRGLENQLYRVEIVAVDGTEVGFAWSRENGSVTASWLATESTNLVVGPVRDAHRGFAAGDWVELGWDGLEAAGAAGTRVQVTAVDGSTLTVDPTTASGPIDADPALRPRPVVRRWDQRARRGQPLRAGAVPVAEVDGDVDRQTLEAGIEVQFARPADGAAAHDYRIGDFWTFTARVATGAVSWPTAPDDTPLAVAPHGPVHHYAPLGWLAADGNFTDLRREFAALAACHAP